MRRAGSFLVAPKGIARALRWCIEAGEVVREPTAFASVNPLSAIARDRSLFETFVENYGYVALFFGTFIEGEMVLVIGAIAAHLGYLKLPWVITWAFLGTLVADQLYFFIGRRKGRSLVCRYPSWQRRAERVLALLHRYQFGFILGFRFCYGLRTVTPFVIGMLPISGRRFLLYNVLGGLIWAVGVAILGYFFGNVLEALFGRLRHFEMAAAVVIAMAALLSAAVYWRRRGDRG